MSRNFIFIILFARVAMSGVIYEDTTSNHIGLFYSTHLHKVHGGGVSIQRGEVSFNGELLMRVLTQKIDIEEETRSSDYKYELSNIDISIGVNGSIGRSMVQPLIGVMFNHNSEYIKGIVWAGEDFHHSFDYDICFSLTTGVRSRIGPVMFDTFYSWTTGRIYTRIGYFFN